MAENVGGIVYEVGMDISGLKSGSSAAESSLSRLERNTNSSSASLSRMDKQANAAGASMTRLSGVAAALTAALSVNQISSYADAWTVLNNKLANAVRASENLTQVTSRVFDITQATRSSLDATATLYARLERGTREYNTSAADLAKLTTIINQGFVVSGATAQEAENAIIQLSQGIASGVLRGEEFNSVSEQGSRLMIALADSLGVGIGQLRAMAAEGKLTTDVVVNGLLSQGSAIGNEFAKTTTTISQALQVAGNNITKFFGENSTVKAGVSVFNSSIISISENIDVLSGALIAVAAVMGSRYVGALAMATAEKIKSIAATRNQNSAELQAAQATANRAAAELRAAASTKQRALDEIRLAEMMRQTAASASIVAAAESRLSAARQAAATATDNYNRALAANAAAQSGLSGGASMISRALGLVGGPAGAAMLAASAVFYFSQRAKEARDAANSLADNVNELTDKFKKMSSTEVAASIAKLRQNIPELTNAVDEAQSKFDSASAKVANLQREIERYGTSTTRGRQASAALGNALDEQAIAAANLDRANGRLSQTNSAVYMGQAQLSGGMRQGIELLKRNTEEATVAAGMMRQLGDAINFASRAKSTFNSSSLTIERPKKVQEYLDKLLDQVEIEGELNERLRAQLKAEKDIRSLGGDDSAVKIARERAGDEYDATEAQREKKKAESEANSEAKKSANQAESVALKLERMKQETELATSATQNLSREQAILKAQQTLGKGATEENIKLAGEYAAAQWDAARATQALSLIPTLNENKQYEADLQALQAALSTKKIDQNEYYTAVEKRAQEHQVTLAKIQAERASGVTPALEAVGGIDPVQALANENARKLALIQQFESQKTITEQQGMALRNSLNTEYEKKRIDAQWEIWRNQNSANELLATSLESFSSAATGALSGILTGSQDVNDALRSIGMSVLNGLINSFVQMGVQWVQSAIMGTAATTSGAAAGAAAQTAAIGTVAAVQTTALAAQTTASVAAAGTTAAAWTPAALLASIASLGTAAVLGIGAVVGVLGASILGKRKNGGPVTAGGMYQVGENGLPEIFQASNGNQYMIPGDNGKVISNKDISGGGSGVIIYNNITNNSSSHVSSTATDNGNGSVTIETIVGDIEENGPIGQAITRNTTATRRANE